MIVKEGMKFRNKEGHEFIVKKWDFYGEGVDVMCAFDGKFIYPLTELLLEEYEEVR